MIGIKLVKIPEKDFGEIKYKIGINAVSVIKKKNAMRKDSFRRVMTT